MWSMRRPGRGPPVGAGEFDHIEDSRSLVRRRVYEAVSAVVSDDHNYERGIEAARAIAHGVLAESGPDALAEMVVELSSRLAEAVGRAAASRGSAAPALAALLFGGWPVGCGTAGLGGPCWW